MPIVHRNLYAESLNYFLTAWDSKGGRPFNSKGNSFTTVQAAIDDLAGDGWVFVPAGTWNETLVIDENNVELFGAGWSSIINGGTSGHAIDIRGDNCVVRDLQCKTTAGQGNSYCALETTGASKTMIERVYASQSDDWGISTHDSPNSLIVGCWADNADSRGILAGNSSRIVGCLVTNAGTWGIYATSQGSNAVIIGCVIDTTGDDGIYIYSNAKNCVVVGNRITNRPLGFDSGSVEFTADEILTGAISGNTGTVSSWTVASGTWGGGDAAGTVYLNTVTGTFNNDEALNGSIGGADIATADGTYNKEAIDDNSATSTVASNDTT